MQGRGKERRSERSKNEKYIGITIHVSIVLY